MTSPYAELYCRSNFSFLRAASHPEELVRQAQELGYQALAITDDCSLAGVVRAHVEAKACGLKLLIGSRLRLEEGGRVIRLILLAADRQGYAALSRLITQGRRAAPKGQYRLSRADLEAGLPGCLAILLAGTRADPEAADWLAKTFAGRAWIGVEQRRAGQDQRCLQQARSMAQSSALPLVACGGVLMHQEQRRPLLDAVTAIRLKVRLADAGFALQANSERAMRPLEQIARLFPAELLAETLRLAQRCHFSLDELRYEYPAELVPAGVSPARHLRNLTLAGAGRRWPGGPSDKVTRMLEHELGLISELGYEPYFLTVEDIVRFARSQGILCQGRGSAANSAVCYCLGITEVDPARMEMLFERFISRERGEPPDIDVDFEHQRREEVIQYIYGKYGRHRAALAAVVICYRPKSALRDLGKTLGLDADQLDRVAGSVSWWDGQQIAPERLLELGLDPDNHGILRWMDLSRQLIGFPRHLSQHPGGFVISRGLLSELVPIENAAMAERTLIQWDKDDLDTLGLLKVDCLALGMLTALHRAFDLLNGYHQQKGAATALGLDSIPAEDPLTYAMIQRAETTGVFQIESRAQMAMLPRLKPACFYDLVIEVAIVRPGPIQGDMVHPYLLRRQGKEPVEYPSDEVREVLGRTLGVPIFQEQVIKVAMLAAGFSPGEADQLRRSIAAWRKRGTLEVFQQRLMDGMVQRGYPEAFAQRIYQQILGFGEYGFPESHAASFALLVYASAWLKCHHPAAFFGAILNSLPMGFYGPAQLVREAKRQGVEVRAVNVEHSDWGCTLEPTKQGQPALRLGLCLIKGLSQEGGQQLVAARPEGGFGSLSELQRRAQLRRSDHQALAAADALRDLSGHRHQAAWKVSGLEPPLPLFAQLQPRADEEREAPCLNAPSEGENLLADYASTGLTLGRHPLALIREQLRRKGVMTAQQLETKNHGDRLFTAGIVINRQRPGGAKGVTFLTLEDEFGHINLVVWQQVADHYRSILLGARLLAVAGWMQREGDLIHVVARRLLDLSPQLGGLQPRSRDFH